MNIGPYCQGQNCSPLNLLFSGVYCTLCDITECSSARLRQRRVGLGKSYFELNASI